MGAGRILLRHRNVASPTPAATANFLVQIDVMMMTQAAQYTQYVYFYKGNYWNANSDSQCNLQAGIYKIRVSLHLFPMFRSISICLQSITIENEFVSDICIPLMLIASLSLSMLIIIALLCERQRMC